MKDLMQPASSFSEKDLDELLGLVRGSLRMLFPSWQAFPQPIPLVSLESPHPGLTGDFWTKSESADFASGVLSDFDIHFSRYPVRKGPCETATALIKFAD